MINSYSNDNMDNNDKLYKQQNQQYDGAENLKRIFFNKISSSLRVIFFDWTVIVKRLRNSSSKFDTKFQHNLGHPNSLFSSVRRLIWLVHLVYGALRLLTEA